MIYIAITFFTLGIILAIISIYLQYRNVEVFDFRTEIINNNYKGLNGFLNQFKNNEEEFLKYKDIWKQLLEGSDHILDKVSYDSMLLSFKPLKLESWYNSEEISFIKHLWKFKNG